MKIQEMRNRVRRVYGMVWAKKVDAMSDTQVVALYYKFVKEGKIK